MTAIRPDDAETQAQMGNIEEALERLEEADQQLNAAQLEARGQLFDEIELVRRDVAGARGRLGMLRHLVNRARRDGGYL